MLGRQPPHSLLGNHRTYLPPLPLPPLKPLPYQEHRLSPLMASTKLHPLEPAPTISVHMSSLNGQATVEALPDSGADVSVRGTTLLQRLQHLHNLLLSTTTPCAINGTTMSPIRKLPMTLSLRIHVHQQIPHLPQHHGDTAVLEDHQGIDHPSSLGITPTHHQSPPLHTLLPPKPHNQFSPITSDENS